jgi:Methyl-accepting chemotaxis protein
MLDQLLNVAPYLKDIFGKDMIVWVSDTDKLLGYFPGYRMDIGSDGILGEDDSMRVAMRKREALRCDEMVGTLGIVVKNTNTPVFDEKNNVVGCISVGVSLDQETKVVNVARSINEAVENMDASIREFAESAENIKDNQRLLRENITGVSELTKEIGKVLSFTKRITDQTNLLGLNASIEAARAGVHGAGFGVVADEICKLSVESMKVAKKIEELLIQINDANRTTLECSDSAYSATVDQAAEILKTKTKITELKSISDELEEIAKDL